MPGEDQERFEDYLELEQFIAELQAGRVAHPSQQMTPAQARIYRMALLLHAATPGASEPRPEFAEQLEAHLTKELQAQQNRHELEVDQAHTPTPISSTRPRKQHVPRRSLLTGGAIAAASALTGVGIEYIGEKAMNHPSDAIIKHPSDVKQITVQKATDWFQVMNVAELGNQAVKFASDLLVGYVVRSDGTNGDPTARGQILAMSAVCTHKGCIIQWSGSDRKYHCPCHGGVFNEDGSIDHHNSSLYLESLPPLEVKVEDEKIYVRVPPSKSLDTSPGT